MADNTLLGSTDSIRTIAKTVNSTTKTSVGIIDIGGGGDGSPETALTAGQKTMSASVPVVLASDQPALMVGLPANAAQETGGNLAAIAAAIVAQGSTTSGQSGVLMQGAVSSAAPTDTNGKTSPLSLDTSGLLRVSLHDSPQNTNKLLVTADAITFASAQPVTQSGTWNIATITTVTTVAAVTAITNPLPAGTNLIGKMGLDQTTPGTTNAVSVPASTVGGATPYSMVSAASTNATVVKNAAGTIYGIQLSNTSASARWLKVFDKATTPVPGTDTPVLNLLIPGATAGAGNNVPIPVCGIGFANGISIAITTGIALLDSGAVGVSEVAVNLDYK